MTLAQVVYRISTDGDFEAQMRSDPISALAQKGLRMSKEELAFLMTVLKREARELTDLDKLVKKEGKGWT
jgi:hypothetical protein